MKPHIHAESSAKHFGGKPEDYLDIHLFLDSSKSATGDLRHRALTHNSWFINIVVPRVFGHTRKNSDDKIYSTIEVAEIHVMEDFRGFIPSPTDFLNKMKFEEWMDNGGEPGTPPPSGAEIKKWRKQKKIEHDETPVRRLLRETPTPQESRCGGGVID